MANQQVTKLAWLAGIIDGEGTVGVRRNTKINQFSPRLNIVNTSARMIEEIAKVYENLGLTPYIREKPLSGLGNKTQFVIAVESLTKSKVVLEAVLPYLVSKRPNAELVLRFVNSRLSHETHNTPYTEDEKDFIVGIYNANGNLRDHTRDSLFG